MASEKGGKGKGAKKSSVSNDKLPVIVFVAGLAIAVILIALSVPKYFTTKIEGDNLAEKKAQLEPVQGSYDTYVQTKADCD